ncbi:hypothetical protein [Telluribacter humicola]|uniref:hypothetical protein n=1 Tax=Telluribacter humicola TaxID=1720261 RepID=UPI001A974D4B|nr:hypothetical protein [Telluribacter humicola]
MLWITMLISGTGTAYAQLKGQDSAWIRYENSLLDSLIRYQQLKEAHVYLQTAYNSQSKEVEELRNAIRMKDTQIHLMEDHHKKEVGKLMKKINRHKWLDPVKVIGATMLTAIVISS